MAFAGAARSARLWVVLLCVLPTMGCATSPLMLNPFSHLADQVVDQSPESASMSRMSRSRGLFSNSFAGVTRETSAASAQIMPASANCRPGGG
jgi:hypothetical protein